MCKGVKGKGWKYGVFLNGAFEVSAATWACCFLRFCIDFVGKKSHCGVLRENHALKSPALKSQKSVCEKQEIHISRRSHSHNFPYKRAHVYSIIGEKSVMAAECKKNRVLPLRY
jgi:hypothetical protein